MCKNGDAEEHLWTRKREEITGRQRKLYNKEVHNLHSSTNTVMFMKSMPMRWTGYVARMRMITNVYSTVVGQHKEKTLLWWENNIKLDLEEMCRLEKLPEYRVQSL
jgi:hypothetical protein